MFLFFYFLLFLFCFDVDFEVMYAQKYWYFCDEYLFKVVHCSCIRRLLEGKIGVLSCYNTHKKLRSLFSFVFKFFQIFPELVILGEHICCLWRSCKLDSSSSVFSALAFLFSSENFVVSPWKKLEVFFSSGGAYGCAPLELGFWSMGGTL